ncbi:hypothetical protein BDW22DRAFT_222735 [Trametopsis cervina]|nr:hypothetical protein BDW22DRAFT_222735 [Trametopsis cervina]
MYQLYLSVCYDPRIAIPVLHPRTLPTHPKTSPLLSPTSHTLSIFVLLACHACVTIAVACSSPESLSVAPDRDNVDTLNECTNVILQDSPVDEDVSRWSNLKIRLTHSVGAGCLYSLRMWRSRRAATLANSMHTIPY